ncbi:MAG: hypothetical protein F6K42_29775 [Leptolyngbya sp. SIO1D8]|nr:hypothetical protein [Leptolyngbya sp. SIO1D8]
MALSLKQFRDRYPNATMLSDLLTVQDEQFVVKVTLHVSEAVTVTGMAADANIEVAEDRARQRALQGLGLEPLEMASLPIKSPIASVPPLPQSFSEPDSADLPVKLPQPTVVSELEPPRDIELQPPVPELKSVPQRINEPAAVAKPKPKTTPKEKALPIESIDDEPLPTPDIAAIGTLPSPVNLSDVIAQTDVELRRLGWSVIDGREYLEETYGKRSRHDLTDEELLAFLLHLEALPTP